MTNAERRDRRERLVGQFLSAVSSQANARWSTTNPDRSPARAYLIRDAFEWADAVIAESDRREKDGE